MSTFAGDFYLTLGRRIRELRHARGLTQEQLGSQLQPPVTRASIANIESGKQRMLAHSLVQLAHSLGVGLEGLVQNGGQPPSDQAIQEELNRKLHLAPDVMDRLVDKLEIPREEQPQ